VPLPLPYPYRYPIPTPIPNQVRTLTEASYVLQRAAHACGLLSNQVRVRDRV